MTYRAPELFSVEPGQEITEKIDVWVRMALSTSKAISLFQSLGCLLYGLLFFRSPFDHVHARGDSVALAVAGADRSTVKAPDDNP